MELGHAQITGVSRMVYVFSLWDGDGNIYPVTVTSGSVTQLKFGITYGATF